MTKIHKQKSGLCRWGCGRKTPNHTGICDGCWKGKSALFIARKREEAKKPKKAISEATRAGLKAYKKVEDKAGVAFTLWSRAGALRLKGDLKPAIEGFKEAKTMFSRMRDRGGVGYCLTGLGGASRVMGRYKDSSKYYTQANSLFRELKDTFGVAYSYCGIANSMRMMGDFKGSLKFFKKAKDNYKKIGDKVSYAYTLWGEGTALQILGRNAEALKDFQESAGLFKETRDRRGLIYCELSAGELDFKQDRKKGVRAFSSALKKAEKLGLGVESRYARELLLAAQKSPESIPLNLA